MIVEQVQLPVAPQGAPSGSRHRLPTQQAVLVVQVWPAVAHAAVPQVPEMAPAGLLHPSPAQQSAEAVQS